MLSLKLKKKKEFSNSKKKLLERIKWFKIWLLEFMIKIKLDKKLKKTSLLKCLLIKLKKDYKILEML